MGNPIVVPFQVMKAAASEGVSGKQDSLNEMAYCTTRVAFIDGLDDIEYVRFKNDLGKLHFLCQKNSLLKGNHLHDLGRVVGLKDFTKRSNGVAFVVPNYDPDTGMAVIIGICTIYVDFKVSIRQFQPSKGERPLRRRVWGYCLFKICEDASSHNHYLPRVEA